MEEIKEISFKIKYDDTETPLIFEDNKTIKEFKEFICLCLDCTNIDNIFLYLENYGQLDSDDILDFPLSLLELRSKNEMNYNLFCVDKTKIESLIKYESFCTQKIFCLDVNWGLNTINQIGLKLKHKENKIICLACVKNCYSEIFNSSLPEDFIVDSKFICQCSQINEGKNCKYNCCELNNIGLKNSEDLKTNKQILMKCINALLKKVSEKRKSISQIKINEKNQESRARDFGFEGDIEYGCGRVINYTDENLKKKVLELVPKRPENSNSEKYVKILLLWFKTKFFSWCNKPKCPKCQKDGDNLYYCREKSFPTENEKKDLAFRTESYCCKNCQNQEIRFPRYNSPLKLLETRRGRCGEWANCFGSILYACGFKTRLVTNFEDHVWNEYYNEEEKRWIHLDPCENAYDSPLMYDQGWRRIMTFVLGHSLDEIVDVTPRYIKNWEEAKQRRNPQTELKLRMLLSAKNQELKSKIRDENYLKEIEERRNKEQDEFDRKKGEGKYANINNNKNSDLNKNILLRLKAQFQSVSDEEKMPRQSGSLEWRKERGEHE